MDVVAKGVELGFSTMTIPEAYGGGGYSTLDFAVAGEQIAWGDAGLAGTICGSGRLGVTPIVFLGSEAQKNHWLTEICSDTSGAYLTAFAPTEPGSGSDLASWAAKATASRSRSMRAAMTASWPAFTSSASRGLPSKRPMTMPGSGFRGGSPSFFTRSWVPCWWT